MPTEDKLCGNIKYYRHISFVILLSLAVAGTMLLFLNTIFGRSFVLVYLGKNVSFGLQLFFWGALGGAIASSLFLAWDKEENELELAKAAPDPTRLRYPNEIDVHLYCDECLSGRCGGPIPVRWFELLRYPSRRFKSKASGVFHNLFLSNRPVPRKVLDLPQ